MTEILEVPNVRDQTWDSYKVLGEIKTLPVHYRRENVSFRGLTF